MKIVFSPNDIVSIACVDNCNGIGKNNTIPWTNKEDQLFFKDITINNIVIMGYKTYISIGHPLKDRVNIIITSKIIDNCTTFNNIDKALSYAKSLHRTIFIIGGESIYKQCINISQFILLTRLHNNYNCDTFFPNIQNMKRIDLLCGILSLELYIRL